MAALDRRIDTSFDFRSDAGGKDPDTYSPTLRLYHQLLWSKPLASGPPFTLSQVGTLLHHRSGLGEFWLSSDSAIVTFIGHLSMAAVTNQFSAGALAEFERVGYTIGGMMIFPAARIQNKMTINGARGLHPRIRDRMDLTLECIRRHYRGQWSPLSVVLTRYADFFGLFETFEGYVSFFYLDDLLTAAGSVRFFMPFDDFKTPAAPADVETYRRFKDSSISFVQARNRRIAKVQNDPSTPYSG